MRQVRASGSLGSGRVTADSFPRGSWPGLLQARTPLCNSPGSQWVLLHSGWLGDHL